MVIYNLNDKIFNALTIISWWWEIKEEKENIVIIYD